MELNIDAFDRLMVQAYGSRIYPRVRSDWPADVPLFEFVLQGRWMPEDASRA